MGDCSHEEQLSRTHVDRDSLQFTSIHSAPFEITLLLLRRPCNHMIKIWAPGSLLEFTATGASVPSACPPPLPHLCPFGCPSTNPRIMQLAQLPSVPKFCLLYPATMLKAEVPCCICCLLFGVHFAAFFSDLGPSANVSYTQLKLCYFWKPSDVMVEEQGLLNKTETDLKVNLKIRGYKDMEKVLH